MAPLSPPKTVSPCSGRHLGDALAALGRYSLGLVTGSVQVVGLLATTFAMLITGGSDGQRISFGAVVRRATDMGPMAFWLTVRFGLSLGVVFGILLEAWLQWADLLEVAIREATRVLVEQVAPLFVAIMVAARSGAALAADLGSMAAAREIDALRSLGLSPERLLVAPAILGALVALPLLTVIMIACILLTLAVYLHFMQISSALLILSLALNAIEPAAVSMALGKGALFGALIVAIAAVQGLTPQPTTRMVGLGVTGAIVTMISTILVLNAILTLVS